MTSRIMSRSRRAGRSMWGRWSGRVLVRAAGLGGGALAPLLGLSSAHAQGPADSLAAAAVYVPAQCTGPSAPRCPLVVFPQVPAFIAGSARAAQALLEEQRALSDRYGAILFVPGSAGIPAASDSLLQRTLRTYAVDPDKIALVGYRAPASMAGQHCPNPTIFSRVALLSPFLAVDEATPFSPRIERSPVCMPQRGEPSPRAVQVYLDAGLGEPAFISRMMVLAPQLRQAGHALELNLSLRGYAAGPDDFERLWHWLSASWTVSTVTPATSSSASATPATKAGADHTPAANDPDPGPLLTTRAIRQLTTFWRHFQREPDSIRTAARLAHQQQLVVPVWAEWLSPSAGVERFSMVLMDTRALAARYPSVRADLRAAGLTARLADVYRRALIIAVANRPLGPPDAKLTVITGTSRLDKNVVFLQTHRQELKALGATGMWMTP